MQSQWFRCAISHHVEGTVMTAKRTIAIIVLLVTSVLAACSGSTLTKADQRACQTANTVFTVPDMNGDETLTTAVFQATSGSVIQGAIDHALYNLRASDFTDLGNDLGYVRALCHQ